MKNSLCQLLSWIGGVLMLASCSDKYVVDGTSSVQELDGKKLYLKIVDKNKLVNIDSSEVIHGSFKFTGLMDSTMMVNLFMDDQSIMPVVLEPGGPIVIEIKDSEQKVSGTPLNNKLYDFIAKRNRIDNSLNELPQRQSQMIMEGVSEADIQLRLGKEQKALLQQLDELETSFITNNFNNVLAPGVFMIMTSSYQYPIMTPQIEDIMSKANSRFKNDPYVKDYIKTAEENMRLMQAMPPGGAPGPDAPLPPPPPPTGEMLPPSP